MYSVIYRHTLTIPRHARASMDPCTTVSIMSDSRRFKEVIRQKYVFAEDDNYTRARNLTFATHLALQTMRYLAEREKSSGRSTFIYRLNVTD